MYATGRMEDLRGNIEVLFFPKTWEKVQGRVHTDARLLVRGRVRQEEDVPPRLIASDVKDLEAALTASPLPESSSSSKTAPPSFSPAAPSSKAETGGETERLVIHVDLERTKEGWFDEVERIVSEFPGDTPWGFELERRGDFEARVRARKPAGLRPAPELLSRLEQIRGTSSVRLERGVRLEKGARLEKVVPDAEKNLQRVP